LPGPLRAALAPADIPTSLELPAEDVTLLRAHARARCKGRGSFSGC
jgi:hypothetical protein